MASARTDLETELRDSLPPSFGTLDDTELAELTAMLRAALDHQRTALTQALDDGLGFMPRLLRIPIKRILGA